MRFSRMALCFLGVGKLEEDSSLRSPPRCYGLQETALNILNGSFAPSGGTACWSFWPSSFSFFSFFSLFILHRITRNCAFRRILPSSRVTVTTRRIIEDNFHENGWSVNDEIMRRLEKHSFVSLISLDDIFDK